MIDVREGRKQGYIVAAVYGVCIRFKVRNQDLPSVCIVYSMYHSFWRALSVQCDYLCTKHSGMYLQFLPAFLSLGRAFHPHHTYTHITSKVHKESLKPATAALDPPMPRRSRRARTTIANLGAYAGTRRKKQKLDHEPAASQSQTDESPSGTSAHRPEDAASEPPSISVRVLPHTCALHAAR